MVSSAALERCVDLGAVEGGEDHGNSAADRWLVVETAEHRTEARRVADRSQRSDRRFSTARVAMGVGDGTERLDRSAFPALSQGGTGLVDDQRVGVAEPCDQRVREGAPGAASTAEHAQLSGAATDRGVRVVQGPQEVCGGEHAAALEGA